MGLLEGVMARKLRAGPNGERYYAPFGSFGRVRVIVDAAASARFARRWRSFYLAAGVLCLAAPVFAPVGSGWFLSFLLALVLAGRAFSAWVARDLPPATVTFAQLPPRTWVEALRAEAQATGRSVIGASLAGGAILTIIMLTAAASSPRDVRLWIAVAVASALTVYVYLSFRLAR